MTVADRDGARWIRFAGELDERVLELKGDFETAVSGARGDVVVDLLGVTFLGTLAVGLFALARDRLADEGRALRLANVPEFVERTFRTMNLDQIFERV